MKVKVTNGITKEEGERTHKIQLKKAQDIYNSFPLATKTWMALRGFPMSWLNTHWDEIQQPVKK